MGGAALGVPGFSTPWASVNGAWTATGSQASQAIAFEEAAAGGAFGTPAAVQAGGDVAANAIAATGGVTEAASAGALGTPATAAVTGGGIPPQFNYGMKGGSGLAKVTEDASKGIVNRLLSGAAEKAARVVK